MFPYEIYREYEQQVVSALSAHVLPDLSQIIFDFAGNRYRLECRWGRFL